MKDFSPEWGFAPPSETNILIFWGCRAILRQRYVDIVPDRCCSFAEDNGNSLEHRFFQEWAQDQLNDAVAQANAGRIDPGSCEVAVIDEGRYHFRYSPKGSYGYLYIGAWMDVDETPEGKKDPSALPEVPPSLVQGRAENHGGGGAEQGGSCSEAHTPSE